MTAAHQTPFADGKAPDAMRTIGEVAAALGIRQHILRYWEAQFPMLCPLKRSGGYTIKGAKAVLAGHDAPARSALSGEEAVLDMKARLLAIRQRLSGALQAA
jgi:hypothetical protein